MPELSTPDRARALDKLPEHMIGVLRDDMDWLRQLAAEPRTLTTTPLRDPAAIADRIEAALAALSQGEADAARLDALEADIRERGPLLLHDGSATGHRGLGLLGRTLREAVDGSLRPSATTDAARAGEASHG